MNKLITRTFLMLFVLSSVAMSQNVVNVTPNVINALSDAVAAAQAGDIFVLQRGGFYYNQGNILVNVPITIRASEGTGYSDLPLMGQVPKEDASWDGQDIEMAANLTIEKIHMNGIRTSRTDATGRAIRFAAENLKLVVDGCVFERYWLRTIGLNDKSGGVIILKNNLGLWDGREDRIDNGRVIDPRSASVDTLILQNNTYLNSQDRIIRHMGGDLGTLKYVKWDHNTFYGNIGYRPTFQFRTVQELVFTNNVVYNVGLLGSDTVSNRIDEIDYPEPREICVFTITGADTLNTTIDMKNNVVFNESRFTDLFAANPDTIKQAPWFNKQWEDRINMSEAVISEELTFGKAPSLDSLIGSLQNYIAGGTKWSNTGFITRTEVLAPEVVDMSYGTTAAAYTGGENGFPVGDLNWYPTKKAEWENFVPTPPPVVVDGEKDTFYAGLAGVDDGYLQLRYFTFNPTNGKATDDADLSAKIWFAWDPTWLYAYAEVMDDKVIATSVNSYQNDVLELKIDPVATTAANSIVGLTLTALDTTDAGVTKAGIENFNNVAAGSKQYARKIIPGGYVLELGVKWSAMVSGTETVPVGVDNVFGLAINFHDNDATTREATVMWAAVMDDHVWDTPAMLGTAKFLADGKLQMIPTNNFTPANTNTLPYDGSDLVGVEDLNQLPTSYALDQNYPNPFNPSTTINYALPEKGLVKISIFNVIGQEVETLVNQEMQAGFHTVNFDASKLSSGIYFYRLDTKGQVLSRKMILLK